MQFRKIVFWVHLTAGIVAGTVILIMSVTGVLLAFQRQITNFADRRNLRPIAAQPASTPLPIEELLQQAALHAQGPPTAVTVYNQTDQPVRIEFGRERAVFVDSRSGAILGEGSQVVRRFFQTVTDWHRWLGTSTETRATGRAITGASNLVFLGILLSGLWLWLPRKWSWQSVRAVLFFRRSLAGKAREFNWHNVTGIWCVVPLLVVVTTATVLSFPWASNALYRMTGNQPPPSAERPAPAAAAGSPKKDTSFSGLNRLFLRAQNQDSSWRMITMRLPSSENPTVVSFTIINGIEGRPDKRAQLVLARDSGEVMRWESFATYNAGRRLRSWFRFLHAGEAGGWIGQAIAAVASAGGAFLMCTGIILAIRRLMAWQARRRMREDSLPTESASNPLSNRARPELANLDSNMGPRSRMTGS